MDKLFLLIIAALLLFFLHEYYLLYFKNIESISDSKLEELFIKLKIALIKDLPKYMVRKHQDDGNDYRRVYTRARDILYKILDRYRYIYLNVENKYGSIEIKHNPNFHINGAGRIVINSIDEIEQDVLLCFCFYLYLGGYMRHTDGLVPDTKNMFQILDYLIDKRNSAEAVFFKGLVFKYGVEIDTMPDLEFATKLLNLAGQKGVGLASFELEGINKFSYLYSTNAEKPA
ncbi:hypothetical protein A1507_12660 [Methylomonas koyamae]|uniref:Uncharacterized protein n=1 Tax=Methylomonas koyamae TaxID=702114 RepID=A0A177NCD4_9GAMM|nr:hypothetical protein [Methylomonas koyamae]OAI15677.1 hypothetical protein A1507_12660 [Methylomonas koyamae]